MVSMVSKHNKIVSLLNMQESYLILEEEEEKEEKEGNYCWLCLAEFQTPL